MKNKSNQPILKVNTLYVNTIVSDLLGTIYIKDFWGFQYMHNKLKKIIARLSLEDLCVLNYKFKACVVLRNLFRTSKLFLYSETVHSKLSFFFNLFIVQLKKIRKLNWKSNNWSNKISNSGERPKISLKYIIKFHCIFPKGWSLN